MKFGPFEIPDSEFVNCAGRIERAKAIKAESIKSLNKETQTVCIEGSDLYTASLEKCSCADFERRGLPCKHMIRLALELGYSFDVPVFDPYFAAEYDVQEDIERLTKRWESGQLTLDALTKCITALNSSAKKAKRRPGRPKKQEEIPAQNGQVQ